MTVWVRIHNFQDGIIFLDGTPSYWSRRDEKSNEFPYHGRWSFIIRAISIVAIYNMHIYIYVYIIHIYIYGWIVYAFSCSLSLPDPPPPRFAEAGCQQDVRLAALRCGPGQQEIAQRNLADARRGREHARLGKIWDLEVFLEVFFRAEPGDSGDLDMILPVMDSDRLCCTFLYTVYIYIVIWFIWTFWRPQESRYFTIARTRWTHGAACCMWARRWILGAIVSSISRWHVHRWCAGIHCFRLIAKTGPPWWEDPCHVQLAGTKWKWRRDRQCRWWLSSEPWQKGEMVRDKLLILSIRHFPASGKCDRICWFLKLLATCNDMVKIGQVL